MPLICAKLEPKARLEPSPPLLHHTANLPPKSIAPKPNLHNPSVFSSRRSLQDRHGVCTMRSLPGITLLALSVLAGAGRAEVHVAPENRIRNVPGDGCGWCALETLARHHG